MKKFKQSSPFYEKQRALSEVECACGCGGYISNRAAKAKSKGQTDGYIKGHGWRGKTFPDEMRLKMSLNHADVSGAKNPNYGKGLFGADNPNWQGGKKEKYYRGKNQDDAGRRSDRAYRKTIIKRDGRCILCGNKTRLECHHIESWVNHPELRFESKNCITLCKPCHTRADNAHHKEHIKPMLEAYVSNL